MTAEHPTPPQAHTEEYTFEHLGKTYSDPYTWLQDKDNPDVIAYIEAENAYAKARLEPTTDLQETLYLEMRGRIAEDDQDVPEKRGDYDYYWRISEGQQYRVFCRKPADSDAEEILIDENALAEGMEYTRVNHMEPSPDNRYIAYSVDTTGAWVFNLHVLDTQTGKEIIDVIPDVAWTIAWAADNRTLFYTTFDHAHRAHQVWRHEIGGDGDDVLIYQEDDEAFGVDVYRSRSGAYVFIHSESTSTSEVRYVDANTPTAEFKIIAPRVQDIEYDVEHHGDRFFIRTNEDAVNFKLMVTPVDATDKANWQTAIDHHDDVLLQGVAPFADHIVFVERKGGFTQVRITAPDDLPGGHPVDFPEPVYAASLRANPEFNTDLLRLTYSSLVTPQSVVDYGMADRSWAVKKQQEIPSGYDASQYVSERLSATAADGAEVPISLVYKQGFERDGNAPLLLYAYGSYGVSMEASFNSALLSLLDRGFAYAIAHIRGGSEMGRAWYEHGRLMHKKNTFTDFIACADHLIAENYTSTERLAILGGSAGGLLVSAVINLRPDLCKAVGAMVPFTNVITAMLTPSLPLTITEYEQWGHPNDEEAFEYMLSYSPYENVQATDYPNIYVKTGINDLQVPYWDPAKWVARLRELKTDDNMLVLVTNMGAGHGGASGRYNFLRERAELYAFFIHTVAYQD